MHLLAPTKDAYVLQPVKAWQVHSRFGQTEENAWTHGNA